MQSLNIYLSSTSHGCSYFFYWSSASYVVYCISKELLILMRGVMICHVMLACGWMCLHLLPLSFNSSSSQVHIGVTSGTILLHNILMMTLIGRLFLLIGYVTDQETLRITDALLDKINTQVRKNRDKEKEMKQKIRNR